MTRLEMLRLVVGRARANGFEFRRWYTTRLDLPWISAEAALILLDAQRRYYALVFSHEFARSFWKPGADITFDVPSQIFKRTMPDGSTRTIRRKPFIRRSARPNAWRYHLRQMALAEEPLRYLRKYLHVEEDLEPDLDRQATGAGDAKAARQKPGSTHQAQLKPLPTGIPDFLQRPYKGSGRNSLL